MGKWRVPSKTWTPAVTFCSWHPSTSKVCCFAGWNISPGLRTTNIRLKFTLVIIYHLMLAKPKHCYPRVNRLRSACVCFICVGSWRTAFQPERTSMQEFHINETTTVMAPLMTHTGRYHYLNDKVRNQTQRCFQQEDSGLLAIPTCCPPHQDPSVHHCEAAPEQTFIYAAGPAWWTDRSPQCRVKTAQEHHIWLDPEPQWRVNFALRSYFLPLKSFTPLHIRVCLHVDSISKISLAFILAHSLTVSKAVLSNYLSPSLAEL